MQLQISLQIQSVMLQLQSPKGQTRRLLHMLRDLLRLQVHVAWACISTAPATQLQLQASVVLLHPSHRRRWPSSAQWARVSAIRLGGGPAVRQRLAAAMVPLLRFRTWFGGAPNLGTTVDHQAVVQQRLRLSEWRRAAWKDRRREGALQMRGRSEWRRPLRRHRRHFQPGRTSETAGLFSPLVRSSWKCAQAQAYSRSRSARLAWTPSPSGTRMGSSSRRQRRTCTLTSPEMQRLQRRCA